MQVLLQDVVCLLELVGTQNGIAFLFGKSAPGLTAVMTNSCWRLPFLPNINLLFP